MDDRRATSWRWGNVTLTAMSSDLNPTTPAKSTTLAESAEPTTMMSLQRYASDQNAVIKMLIGRGRFRDFDHPDWKDLFDSTWGANLDDLDTTEKVQRDPDPIDDSLILPDVVPLDCNVMPNSEVLDRCWPSKCDKFFIRSEYKEAEQFALSAYADGFDALIVTGQPGIGLSLFRLHYGRLKSIHQGNPSFYIVFSCGALRSNFQPHYKPQPTASCFSARRV